MRKIFFCILSACLTSAAFAGIDEGINSGMTHVFVNAGAAMPITEYVLGSDEDVAYGDAGFSYGAQIIHYIVPAFGLGLEFNGTNYGTKTTSNMISGWESKYTTSADKYSFFLAGKAVLNPSSKTRLYIPVGAGFSRFKAYMKSEYAPDPTYSAYIYSTKPAFYAGLGMESDLNDIFLFGFEARYNGFWLDKDKFSDDNSYMDDVSLLLKFGIKF